MKKSFIAGLALLASISFANAQTTVTAPAAPAPVAAPEVQQQERVKVKTEDLPEAVKKSLASEDYRGWLISAAYEVKSKNRFEVELKNGAETKTVIVDKEGNKVD